MAAQTVSGNAGDGEIAADFRGHSRIKKISRESTRKTRTQFDSCSFAQIRG
jgi:hypothetical protein